MTVADAARELGISPRRVRSLISSGRLAAQKVGWGWLIEPRALAAVRERKPGRPAKQ